MVCAVKRCLLVERVALSLLVSIAGSGCSLFGGGSLKTVGAGSVPIEATSGIDPDVTPFVLEVLDEKNNGEKLEITGRILPKAEWPASKVVVKLSALDKQGQERVSFHRMSDLLVKSQGSSEGPPMLHKGVARTFALALPLKGLSSYQLEAVWGSDAGPFAAPDPEPEQSSEATQPNEFIALRGLEVHRVPSESCAQPDECVLKYTITGEIFNSGSRVVRDVEIVAGFSSPSKLDLAGQTLEDEKRVRVPNLRLAPGKAQRFRISLEKLFPSTTESAPQPVVKIASFQSE
jgi:hypothetical protein